MTLSDVTRGYHTRDSGYAVANMVIINSINNLLKYMIGFMILTSYNSKAVGQIHVLNAMICS
jgi:hypothetical protein